MKSWISALTWNFLRLVAPVRRTFHAAFDVAKMLEERCDFDCAKSVQSGGMTLRARLWLVALEKKAHDAQIAHDNNDVRGCFAVVRALSGGKPRAQKTILEKNGEKTHKEKSKKREVALERSEIASCKLGLRPSFCGYLEQVK